MRSPAEPPQGPGLALLGGDQWRRQPSRAISPLETPPDQAGSGLGRTGPRHRGGAGRERTRHGAPHGFASASADLPASVSICETGCAGKWVPETRSSLSMLLAPTRAHLAQPQRGDSEAGPALWEPRGPLRRSGTPSVAPGLADPGSRAPWLCAPANTVAGGRAPTSGNTAAAPPLARSRPPRPARGQAAGLGRGRAEHPLSLPTSQPRAGGEVGLTPTCPARSWNGKERPLSVLLPRVGWGWWWVELRVPPHPPPQPFSPPQPPPPSYLFQRPYVVVVGAGNPVLVEGAPIGWWGLPTQRPPSGPWL